MVWTSVIENLNIPLRFQNCSIENLDALPSHVTEIAKKWINSPQKPSIFLTGCVGSGKTHFMTALFRAIVEKYDNVDTALFCSIFLDTGFPGHPDQNTSFIEQINSVRKKNEHHHFNVIQTCDFLFLDDQFGYTTSEKFRDEFFDILDHRIFFELPIIFCTTLSRKEFEELMGKRIKSKLNQCLEISLPEIDLRQTKYGSFNTVEITQEEKEEIEKALRRNMKFELVEFYPAEEKTNVKSKKGFVGTAHIYLADYGIDIRGIGVCCNNGRMFFNMPNRVVNNHESGFVFKYPIITWRNDSVNKELMDFLHEKVKPIALESLNAKTDNGVA